MRTSRMLKVLCATFAAIAFCTSRAECDGKELSVGSAAPSFECKDETGKIWKSQDHFGHKTVVVYFYPAAMTGGCTKQACAYRDDKQSLTDRDVEVIGVSGDQVQGLQLFKKAHDLNFTLLADTDGAVAKAFGVPLGDGGEITREIDGQDYILKRGVTSARWTFVVGKDGKITSINKKVNAAEDSKLVLKLLDE